MTSMPIVSAATGMTCGNHHLRWLEVEAEGDVAHHHVGRDDGGLVGLPAVVVLINEILGYRGIIGLILSLGLRYT